MNAKAIRESCPTCGGARDLTVGLVFQPVTIPCPTCRPSEIAMGPQLKRIKSDALHFRSLIEWAQDINWKYEIHSYDPGSAGRFWGPPGDCYPDDPPEVDFTVTGPGGLAEALESIDQMQGFWADQALKIAGERAA